MISARLLKDSTEVISAPLTKLFNLSLQSSVFPSIWKSAKVSALFKGGDVSAPGNYRPISALPTISKILERAVHIQLYDYLESNKLLTSKQFGFCPRLSTTIAASHFSDPILYNMDNGLVTGAVYLYLAKAFDAVDHSLLLPGSSLIYPKGTK